MKKILVLFLSLILVFSLFACDNSEQENVSSNDDTSGAEGESSLSEESQEPVQSTVINSLNYTNQGRMGDTDGPAFAVYSKKGYNAASVVLDIPSVTMKNVLPDGRYLNGYSFLGIDVYDGDYWMNCVDAGLCWSGQAGGWHVFYNIYETINPSTPSWYESRKILPSHDSYIMLLQIIDDDYARLTVRGQTTGVTDDILIQVKGAKKDGSNTAMLFNCALDFPPDTKVDRNGAPSNNWTEITLANSDLGIQFKSLNATELTLFERGEPIPWTNDKNDSVSIWPDKDVIGFDYAPTEITLYDGTEYLINFDMNRWE